MRLTSSCGAAVTLPGQGRQVLHAALWADEDSAAGSRNEGLIPLCEHVAAAPSLIHLAGDELQEVAAAAADPEGIACILGIPIPTADGGSAGSLVVVGREPRDWSSEERESLADVAAHLSDLLTRTSPLQHLPPDARSFRAFIETSSEYVAVLSAGGVIRYLSGVTSRRLGMPAEALVGRSAWELLHPEEVPGAIRCFTDSMKTPGASAYAEMRVRAADAEWGTFELQLKNLLDEPSVEGVLITARDLTAHRVVEDNQRRLQAIIEATPDFVATLDPRGKALYVNPAGRRMIGIDRDAVRNLNIPDFFTQVETERMLTEGIPTASRQGLWRAETVLQDAQGGEIPVSQVLLAHRSPDGEVNFLSVMARDISAQKRVEEALRSSEEHFRALIENGLDVIYLMDAEGRISYCSPSIERVLGYMPDELIGRYVWEFVHPDDLENARERTRLRLETEDDMPPFEAYVRHKDGSWRLWEMRAQNLLDHPAVTGIIVNSRDVTARKQAEDELEESREQLLQSQRMEAVGRLAGGVAHDFNNLLTAIKGFAELLLMEMDPNDSSLVFVEEIKKAGDRAVGLTRQLLAFSRKQVLQPRVLDLGDVVEQMENMLRRLIGEDIYLGTRRDPQLWQVRADPGQMEQVILNLAVNARDAMPTGGRLTIATENLALDESLITDNLEIPAGEYIRLIVTDTGYGMEEDTRARIFEPFFTTKEKGKGTGLGLSTVYGIVTQSGGLVEVESTRGDGSSFKVYLPRVIETVEDDPEPVRQAPERGHETIFLVEDEAAVRSLVARVLKKSGYTVIEAMDGQQAVELIEGFEEPIHLLLTDVVMPGLSGRDLAERLVPDHPDMKVLYMSGYTDDAIVHLGVRESDIEFIGKPFTPDTLLRRVRAVLDGQKP